MVRYMVEQMRKPTAAKPAILTAILAATALVAVPALAQSQPRRIGCALVDGVLPDG